jgi:beta-glucanase (GH16 family)
VFQGSSNGGFGGWDVEHCDGCYSYAWFELVFSDEFQVDGRTVYPGDDQFCTTADLHYSATGDLEWYDQDTITTKDRTLNIVMNATPMHGLNPRSGMLQSWNKLCFKGGVMEVSASLAEPAGVTGLWPGIWTLDNLAI